MKPAPQQEDYSGQSGGREGGNSRRPFFRRRKICPFSGDKAPKIDYKDVRLLQKFVSERGKLSPVGLVQYLARSNVCYPRRSNVLAF